MSLPDALSDDAESVWRAIQEAVCDAPYDELAAQNELTREKACAFSEALQQKNVAKFTRLVAQHGNPNATIFGESLLYRAALRGSLPMFTSLLAYGALMDVRTRDGATVVHAAVEGGSRAILAQALAAGVSADAPTRSGVTPLQLAYSQAFSLSGMRPFLLLSVSLLLQHGAVPNQYVRGSQTPLIDAVRRRDTEMMMTILQQAPHLDLNYRDAAGCTPLCNAARSDDEVLEALLHAGADPNALCTPAHEPRHTALDSAARNARFGAMSLLLKDGGARANLCAVSPLLLCARSVPFELAVALINAGAAVDDMNADGNTALHSALEARCWPVASLLIAVRAKTTLLNNAGKSALDLIDEIGESYSRVCDCAAHPLAEQKLLREQHNAPIVYSAPSPFRGAMQLLQQNKQILQRLEWLVVHQHIFDVCTALQTLELPVLLLLHIVDEMIPFSWRVRMARKWDAIVAVRHFCERKASAVKAPIRAIPAPTPKAPILAIAPNCCGNTGC